jgi:RHS repeat-associated protein
VYSYDPANSLLQSQSVQRGGSSLLNLTYRYFPGGQLMQLSEGSETLNYDYDALARLLDVKASGTTTWSQTYSYDSYGNRIGTAATGQGLNGLPIPLDGLAGSPAPPNGLSALTYDARTNRVVTPGFNYDAAGNQIRAQRFDGSWVRYKYDQANRPIVVTDDNGTLIEQYAYGVDGRRLQTANKAATKTYFWDANNVVAEYMQASGAKKWAWSKGHVYLRSRILATVSIINHSKLVQYHHPDRLGVRMITNNLDNNTREQTTLPFGTLLPGTSPNPVNPIFTDYDRSPVTGSDYAVHRTYDPQERFTQVDPAEVRAMSPTRPQSLNLYAYVNNDPINATDIFGLLPCKDPAECGGGGGGDDWAQGGASAAMAFEVIDFTDTEGETFTAGDSESGVQVVDFSDTESEPIVASPSNECSECTFEEGETIEGSPAAGNNAPLPSPNECSDCTFDEGETIQPSDWTVHEATLQAGAQQTAACLPGCWLSPLSGSVSGLGSGVAQFYATGLWGAATMNGFVGALGGVGLVTTWDTGCMMYCAPVPSGPGQWPH